MHWNRPLLRPKNDALGKLLRPITPTYIAASVILGLLLGASYLSSQPTPIYEAPMHIGASLLTMVIFVYIPSGIYYGFMDVLDVPQRPEKKAAVGEIATTSPAYPRLWYTIAFRWMSVLVLIAAGVLFLATPSTMNQLGAVVEAAGYALFLIGGGLFVLSLIAPLAVMRDRGVLEDGDPWRPSLWYYAMAFPTGLLGLVLSAVYTRKRLRHYGIKSSKGLARTLVFPENEGDD